MNVAFEHGVITPILPEPEGENAPPFLTQTAAARPAVVGPDRRLENE